MDNRKSVCIIVAQEEESDYLINLLNLSAISISENTNLDIHLCPASGVGMLNAAYATYCMQDKFKLDTVINVGVAAGRGSLAVGDLVYVDKVYNGDFDISVFNHDKYYMPEIGDYISSRFNRNLAITNAPCFSVSKFCGGDVDTSIRDYVIDMEYYGIAYMCKKLDIPHYCAIKCVSDTTHHDNNKEYEENLRYCSIRMAHYIVDYLLSTN